MKQQVALLLKWKMKILQKYKIHELQTAIEIIQFLTGKPISIMLLFNAQKGQPANFIADDPGDSVEYIEAHDGLTYHDTICAALKIDPLKDKDEIYKRMKLGNLMVLTSQGVAFLHAGQEMARTKEWKGAGLPSGENKEGTLFIRNSYDSSDIINMIDWQRIEDPYAKELLEYTKGLITLRKSTDAFRLGDKSKVDSNIKLIGTLNKESQDIFISFSCKDTDGTTYYIFVNADKTAREIKINEDLTNGQVIVDNDEAGIFPVKNISGVIITAETIKVQPLTAVIIKK